MRKMIMDVLDQFYSLLGNQLLIDDDREPIQLFEISNTNKKFGILLPNVFFWIYLTYFFLIQVMILLIVGIFVYKFIVLSRITKPIRQPTTTITTSTTNDNNRNATTDKNNTTTTTTTTTTTGNTKAKTTTAATTTTITTTTTSTSGFMFGYGIIIPMGLFLPYKLLTIFNVQSTFFALSWVGLPTYVTLRCLECMHGTMPVGVEESWTNFLLYFTSFSEIMFDPKTRQPQRLTTITRRKKILKTISILIRMFMTASILLSLTRPYGFKPFSFSFHDNKEDVKDNFFLYHYFSYHHFGNNFVSALLLYSIINCFSRCNELVTNFLLGYQTNDFMANPMFQSKSPSDFWNRWNQNVQRLFKRGIYKPIMQQQQNHNHSNNNNKYSMIAFCAVFLFSCIMHEYVNILVFVVTRQNQLQEHQCQQQDCNSDDYYVYNGYGKVTIFFLYNGFLIVMEKLCNAYLFSSSPPYPLFQSIPRKILMVLPAPVLSLLVVSLTLPISHLFTDDCIDGGIFHSAALGLPIFVLVD